MRKTKKLQSEKLKEVVYNTLLRNPKKRLNARQIVIKRKLGNSYQSVNSALEKLLEEEAILFVKDGKYRVNKKKIQEVTANKKTKKQRETSVNKNDDALIGIVDLIRTGAAYVMVQGMPDDIYVPAKHTLGARDGDTVKLRLSKKSRRKPEGKISQIVKRNQSKIIGKIRISDKQGIIYDDENRLGADVIIPKKNLGGAKDGDQVIVALEEYTKSQNDKIFGVITKVLSNTTPSDIAMNNILFNHGFDTEFPEEVITETNAIDGIYTEEEIAKRRDFREVFTITIDPDTAKDFDDAISYEVLDNKNIEIGIHIADVTHYVKFGSPLDQEAAERTTSVYLVDRVCPMLPEKLSNNLCSLMPNVDRYTFSAVFTFNEKLEIVKKWFGKAIIHSDRRYSYMEAQGVLDTKKGPHADAMLKINEIAHQLRKDKFKKGAIAFESDEVKFQLDEKSKPIGVYIKERKDAHMLVEDFMLLANKEVARYISSKKVKEIPFVYRVHDAPNPDKLSEFSMFAKEFGIEMKIDTPKQIANSFNKLAKKAKEDEMMKMLEPMAIRCMAKAEYHTDNIGHYGLAFDHYAHFTSPIRRYADVLVHRILEKNLEADFRISKSKLQEQCAHISLQERKAMKAERASIKYKQVEYLEDKIGEEFEGFVSGMIDRGVFVQLKESRAESLVSFEQMGEQYIVAESRLEAKAKNSNKKLKMGANVRVRLIRTDIDKSQFELEII